MDRQIVYFQIPSFEIALIRRQEAALRSRPVVIAPTHSTRACLREVSQEAHEDGLRPGMTVELARRLCPRMHLFPPDSRRADTAHQSLQHIVAEFAPIWESVQPGHIFLDLTGTRRLFGPAVDTAIRIERDIIRREQLTGMLGVGTNKLVSRVATTIVQPSQLCEVRPGLEPNFLKPLPSSSLPSTYLSLHLIPLRTLEDLNLRTFGQIADIPLAVLQLALGPAAVRLHEWACGIDPSPVRPAVQQPCVERSVSITPDAIDDERLLGLLYRLLEQLCRTLRHQNRLSRRLGLTIRHADHVEVSKQRLLENGTWCEQDVYPLLTELFFHCFRRRVRLRLMTVRLDCLESPALHWGPQLDLFNHEPVSLQRHQSARLTVALDHLRDRFGDRIIQRGRTFSLDEKH